MMPGAEFDSLSTGELRAMLEWCEMRECVKDQRAGVLACAIVNSQISKDSGIKPFAPWDFFPRLEKLKPPPPSDAEAFALIVAAFC